MKAGERERASALRLVLSELQKAAKDGSADEQAVLRRERKRRLDAAEQYEAAARPELAAPEREEAVLIEGYLPPSSTRRSSPASSPRRSRAPAPPPRGTWAR